LRPCDRRCAPWVPGRRVASTAPSRASRSEMAASKAFGWATWKQASAAPPRMLLVKLPAVRTPIPFNASESRASAPRSGTTSAWLSRRMGARDPAWARKDATPAAPRTCGACITRSGFARVGPAARALRSRALSIRTHLFAEAEDGPGRVHPALLAAAGSERGEPPCPAGMAQGGLPQAGRLLARFGGRIRLIVEGLAEGVGELLEGGEP